MPSFSIIFGSLIDSLQSPDKLVETVGGVSLLFLYLGIGAFVVSLGEVGLPSVAAERQILRVRQEYMRALLRQPMAFWDANDPGEVASRLAEDTITMAKGMGENLGNFAHFMASGIVGLGVGF